MRINIPIDRDPNPLGVTTGSTDPSDAGAKFARIPGHLVPIIQAIAKRQCTTPEMVIAQAISDYCHRGL